MNKYNPVILSEMTPEEHIEKLKYLISWFIMYGDETTFKKVLLNQDDDYFLIVIRDMKIKGVL